MKCDDLRHNIIKYTQGKLTKEDSSEVEEHMKDCSQCREEVTLRLSFQSKVDNQRVWAPPDAYWNTILPRLHKTIETRRTPELPYWLFRIVLPAAAAVLLIVFIMEIAPKGKIGGEAPGTALFSGVTQDELRSYLMEQSIVGLNETIRTYPAIHSSDDAFVLASLADNENQLLPYLDDDQSLVNGLSDKEAASFVSIMEKNVNQIGK